MPAAERWTESLGEFADRKGRSSSSKCLEWCSPLRSREPFHLEGACKGFLLEGDRTCFALGCPLPLQHYPSSAQAAAAGLLSDFFIIAC